MGIAPWLRLGDDLTPHEHAHLIAARLLADGAWLADATDFLPATSHPAEPDTCSKQRGPLTFTGFTSAASGFLDALGKDNSREFFDAHRHIEAGGGIYEPSRDQLVRARTAIDAAPTAARELSAIIDSLRSAGFEMAGPSLTTAPRGYDRDHPHIELLRLKHYAAVTTLPVTAAPDDIRSAWKAVDALIQWGNTYVKAAESWP